MTDIYKGKTAEERASMEAFYEGKTAEERAAMDAFFAKGGTITRCPVNERTEGLVTNIWKRGPGRPTKEQAEKAAKAEGDE